MTASSRGCPLTPGIIAALPGEARPLARLRPLGRRQLSGGAVVMLSGVGAERASTTAERLADQGVQGLVSWGTAAALVPDMMPGDLVLAQTVQATNGQFWSTHADWREWLQQALPAGRRCHGQTLIEAPALVADVAAKQQLHADSGAIACDMESAAIAEVAARRGLAMIVVRAVIDDATMILPPVARHAMDDEGRLQFGGLVKSMVGRPSVMTRQARELQNLAVAFRAARLGLTDAARAINPPATH